MMVPGAIVVMMVSVAGCCLWSSHSETAMHHEPEIHLLPLGYEGGVLILYDRSDGKPLRCKDGVRMLDIPPDGLLLTSAKAQADTAVPPDRVRFYHGTSLERQTELREMHNWDTLRLSDGVCIYARQVGEVSHGDTHQKYESYMVMRATANIDSMDHALRRKLFDIVGVPQEEQATEEQDAGEQGAK